MSYSYDIFDTCLIRACGYPEAVFDILAEKILGVGCNNALYADFAKERRDGESRARVTLINDYKEEITIEDIYSFCDFSIYTNKDKVSIMEMELEIEKKMLCPVKSIYEEISTLHKNNIHVLFISDMYLPIGFIKAILQDNNLFAEGDHLFVSCEIGKTKRTGNLFRYIHDTYKIDYANWIHYGDNEYSDILIPKKLGIKTKKVTYVDSHYEKLLINKEIYINKGYLARVANISKAIRYKLGDSPHISFAADFVAPIYVPFVYYLLNDANQNGIRHLFFLARDAYIFYIIANSFIHLFPKISIHYIYVSRKSLYLPGLKDITEESITNLFIKKVRLTIEEVLDMLQMSDYPISDLLSGVTDIKESINLLLKDTKFISQLKERQKNQKEFCLSYFRECGLTNPNSAIIDLAGTRKCHDIINRLLTESGCNSVFGYYLEILSDRVKGTNYEALYFDDRYRINERHINPLFPQELFEQYFSITNHSRTASYIIKDNKVMPVFEEDLLNLEYKKKVFNINQKVSKLFADYYLYLINGQHEYICRNAIDTYASFYQEPMPHYLKALEGLIFSDSTNNLEPVLYKDSFIKTILNWKKYKWGRAQIIYNCPCPNLLERFLHYFSIAKKNI